MKKIVLSLAFVLMGTLAFANTGEVKPATKVVAKEVFVKSENTKSDEDKQNSCTVTVKTGTRNVTITVTCECTVGQACNQAYAIASFGLQ